MQCFVKFEMTVSGEDSQEFTLTGISLNYIITLSITSVL